MDYQGNSEKSKKPRPEKKAIEKVIETEVVVKKKPFGARFRDVIIAADFRSVNQYLLYDVLIPAFRNTVVDVTSKGIQRMMYGESAIRRRDYGAEPRVTYNNPINRNYRDPGPPRGNRPYIRDARTQQRSRDDIVLTTREEAEIVLERMNDIIDTYDVVSVADLNDLVGLTGSHVDNKWGWVYLGDVQIQQIREGYLLNLPAAEPIN
jgi:hypothetical protein